MINGVHPDKICSTLSRFEPATPRMWNEHSTTMLTTRLYRKKSERMTMIFKNKLSQQ